MNTNVLILTLFTMACIDYRKYHLAIAAWIVLVIAKFLFPLIGLQ